jgi:hypothetical protein
MGTLLCASPWAVPCGSELLIAALRLRATFAPASILRISCRVLPMTSPLVWWGRLLFTWSPHLKQMMRLGTKAWSPSVWCLLGLCAHGAWACPSAKRLRPSLPHYYRTVRDEIARCEPHAGSASVWSVSNSSTGASRSTRAGPGTTSRISCCGVRLGLLRQRVR